MTQIAVQTIFYALMGPKMTAADVVAEHFAQRPNGLLEVTIRLARS